jgi:lipopolysaccharide export LptBFGC system permease protein LptF
MSSRKGRPFHCAGYSTTVRQEKLQARLWQVFFALAAVGGFVLAAAPIEADAGMRAVGVAGIILGAGFWFWVTVLLNRRK